MDEIYMLNIPTGYCIRSITHNEGGTDYYVYALTHTDEGDQDNWTQQHKRPKKTKEACIKLIKRMARKEFKEVLNKEILKYDFSRIMENKQ